MIIYIQYNSEHNSYELKTDNEEDEKEYIIMRLYTINKKN